jgi:hypothetical protein
MRGIFFTVLGHVRFSGKILLHGVSSSVNLLYGGIQVFLLLPPARSHIPYVISSTSLSLRKPSPCLCIFTQLDLQRLRPPQNTYTPTEMRCCGETAWRPQCWLTRRTVSLLRYTRTARKVFFVTSIIRGRLYSKYVCEEDSFEELYFMLDGITRRFALYVRAWLEEFVGRWIGRRGPMSSGKSRSYSL